MPTPRKLVRTDMTRVWLMEGGAGPGTAPQYMGVWRAGAVSWDFGEATNIEIPSSSEFMKFEAVDSLPGTEGKPGMTLTAKYARDLSDMLRLARRRCVDDIQIAIGSCGDVQDRVAGWDKIAVLERVNISNYGTGELGALQSDERDSVTESLDIQATDYFEIGKLSFAEICAAAVLQEVLAVTFCDAISCGGECGTSSDGCKKLFALIKSVGGSPGLGAQVVFSDDGGSTCDSTPITTLPANEDPNAMVCLGQYIVVFSEDSESHHYAEKAEILAGTETWAEMVTGYVAAKGPLCAYALKAGYCWIGAEGGYVYFLDAATNGVTVQEAGSATVQNLLDIHAFDEENVLAVGASNAVIHTTDGATWTAVTGPAVGVNLNACWMLSETKWLVGTAGGALYYTEDSGVTWTLKGFSGSGAGVIRDIVFHGAQVGYMSHDTAAAAGRILRTIDGGYSWYVLPEGTGAIPANDRINSLAVCDNPNLVVGGGLGDNAADGFMVKASA